MALIQCPECGKQISDKAPACPNCGAPVGEYIDNNQDNSLSLIDQQKVEKDLKLYKRLKVYMNITLTILVIWLFICVLEPIVFEQDLNTFFALLCNSWIMVLPTVWFIITIIRMKNVENRLKKYIE